jgi:hypothetical protein
MRGRFAMLVAVPVVVAAGCIDLFHSTDFSTPCDLDATATGCQGDEAHPGDERNPGDGGNPEASDGGGGDGSAAEDAGPTDFCAWEAGTSYATAHRACAWLGACAGPYGNNEFGTCIDYALRAYHCELNPSMPVLGATHAYWDCLQKARSCRDVKSCVLTVNCPPGGSPFVICSGATRMSCPAGQQPGPALGAENCVAVGQTCRDNGGSPECSAANDGECHPLGCASPTLLRDCNGSQDRGVNCSLYGGGSCKDGGLAACEPSDRAPSCTVSGTATCNTGTVTACFTGREQRLDCRALMEDAGTCDLAATSTQPLWDLSRYCVPNTAGGCTESCSGPIGSACHRGKAVTLDCPAFGLGPCEMVSYGAVSHPACTPPI